MDKTFSPATEKFLKELVWYAVLAGFIMGIGFSFLVLLLTGHLK